MSMSSNESTDAEPKDRKTRPESVVPHFHGSHSFCRKTNLSYSKFLRMVHEGKIPVARVGNRLLIPNSFLESLEKQAYQSLTGGSDGR